ncbi:MAG: 2,3-bisphosphoglycerate-independent phosphoglycerate mutase [Oscillospiraceae bacterium]|nr:2,3-bisphosphoglycerate-independent phosphoglycerate mutase [Oscillospiraceae bacterium]
MKKTPTLLLIMDGYGLGEKGPGNAVESADTPNLDGLFLKYPHCSLLASGESVGLPDGQIGNSEVGHTNIGAGRVVYQDLTRISKSIREGRFFSNPAYTGIIDACKKSGGALHFIGLVSDGGVHSHIEHLFALLEMSKKRGLDRVYIHAFLDGRDVGPKTGEGYIKSLDAKCKELGVGKIATVMGRFYAMDRDNRWERVETAYNAMVRGEGRRDPDPPGAVAFSYAAGKTDEFMEPAVCDPEGVISEGDGIININFRPDRAREITYALTDPSFSFFDRRGGPSSVNYVCTATYDEKLKDIPVAFPPESLDGVFGEYLSGLGYTQLRIAETEKYAHVTFFFNGGSETVCAGEDRALIPSPKEVPTYDLKPQMSANEVTDECVKRISSGKYDVIICNLANCDMVGHTGIFDAAVKAVETVDSCVGRIVGAVSEAGGKCFITADHGNAEQMFEHDGTPHTAHTLNPVPFLAVGAGDIKLKDGLLADIAPTLLDVMGLDMPGRMTGKSLIVK